jgi:hypothetical protein
MEIKTMKKTELNKNIYLSTGNKKLKENETSFFLIWNLPAVTTCPYATELCKKSCYARKAERLYPQVLPSRELNYQESLKPSFVQDMIDHIQYQLDRPKNKGKKCYFRIHESGDLFSLDYFIRWTYIASCFPEVQFLAYTKSIAYIYLYHANGYKVPNNLIIRFSVWDDTNQMDIEIAKKLDLPIYTAFDKKVLDEKIQTEDYNYCHCNCQTCKMCYTSIKRIATAIH